MDSKRDRSRSRSQEKEKLDRQSRFEFDQKQLINVIDTVTSDLIETNDQRTTLHSVKWASAHKYLPPLSKVQIWRMSDKTILKLGDLNSESRVLEAKTNKEIDAPEWTWKVELEKKQGFDQKYELYDYYEKKNCELYKYIRFVVNQSFSA